MNLSWMKFFGTISDSWCFMNIYRVSEDIITFFSTLKLSNYSAAPSSCRVFNVAVKTIYVPSGVSGGSNLGREKEAAAEERFLSPRFIYQQQHQQQQFHSHERLTRKDFKVFYAPHTYHGFCCVFNDLIKVTAVFRQSAN